MSEIKTYPTDTPDNKDMVIGTDQNGQTKNFMLEKLAEFFTSFFHLNQNIDFRTPQPYPDNTVIENGKVNLDKVTIQGLWYFNKPLKYMTGVGNKELSDNIEYLIVIVDKFENAGHINIKQGIFDYKLNKIYTRSCLDTELQTTDLKKAIKLTEIDTTNYPFNENDVNALVNIAGLDNYLYNLNALSQSSTTKFRFINGDYELDDINGLARYMFNANGNLTVNGVNLSTLFSEYKKEFILVDMHLVGVKDINGDVKFINRQKVTNLFTGDYFIRYKYVNGSWGELHFFKSHLSLNDIDINSYTTDYSNQKSVVNLESLNKELFILDITQPHSSFLKKHKDSIELDSINTDLGYHIFDELGDLTIAGVNLNTIFTTNYLKALILVENKQFGNQLSGGGIVNLFIQKITNLQTGEYLYRTYNTFGNTWSAYKHFSGV